MDYKTQITNRLVEVLEKVFSNNRSEFGRRVGVKESRIRSYTHEVIGERSMPSADFIASVIMNIEINHEWLLFGKGEMMGSDMMVLQKSGADWYVELLLSQQETIKSQQETIKFLANEKNNTAGIA